MYSREPKLSPLAQQILRERYLLRNEEQEIIETPGQLYYRVAKRIAEQEIKISDQEKWTEIFLQGLLDLDWSPASPCLMNAGTQLEQLSACFVLDIQDSMEEIFQTLKEAALIYKTGGGVGFNFGRLREKGSLVKSTMGFSSGTVAWLKVYNCAIEAIAQGGKRRGAALGVLPLEHPDILDWLQAKTKDREIVNFNLSVAVNDAFFARLKEDKAFSLISPLGYQTGELPAHELWTKLCHQAWLSGEPGIFFIDRANEDNPNPHLGRIYNGNPCSEFLAVPYSSCNLASINLEGHLTSQGQDNWTFNWSKFKDTIHTVVRFLDNMLEANKLPLPQLQAMAQATRPIGLGFMGLARVLKALKLGYHTKEGRAWAEKMIQFLRQEAEDASRKLAEERGVYPAWPGSRWQAQGIKLRNSNLLSIAPTGTIATLTNTSWSLEPEFAPIYQRRILGGQVFWEMDPQLEQALKTRNLDTPELREELKIKGTLQSIDHIPPDLKEIFVYALDIKPQDHLLMQAVIQKHVDGAISKTINLPTEATPADVDECFRVAYELGLKGCTVYRQGTRLDQVLSLTKTKG